MKWSGNFWWFEVYKGRDFLFAAARNVMCVVDFMRGFLYLCLPLGYVGISSVRSVFSVPEYGLSSKL